jgi:hypothetical protein
VVAFYPPTDLVRLSSMGHLGGMDHFLGGSRGTVPGRYRHLSPVSHVDLPSLRGRRPDSSNTGLTRRDTKEATRKKTLTSENSVHAKFPELPFSALGRSLFDGTAPTEIRAHLSDDQCQRICLRHLLYPATTSSMRIVYCLRTADKALDTNIGGFRFTGFAGKSESRRADSNR